MNNLKKNSYVFKLFQTSQFHVFYRAAKTWNWLVARQYTLLICLYYCMIQAFFFSVIAYVRHIQSSSELSVTVLHFLRPMYNTVLNNFTVCLYDVCFLTHLGCGSGSIRGRDIYWTTDKLMYGCALVV